MKIKDTEIKLKFSLRVMFIFEKLAGKPFNIQTTLDMYILLYSVIMANNSNVNILFDELIDICDADPTIFNEFTEWMSNTNKINSQFNDDDASDKKKA